jgi:hypothetical protein
MEYVWSILGRKWGERWPLPRKEEAREPTKMLAKKQRKLIFFFAFRLPPYGGKSDVDNIGVCAKRGGEATFVFFIFVFSCSLFLKLSSLFPYND